MKLAIYICGESVSGARRVTEWLSRLQNCVTCESSCDRIRSVSAVSGGRSVDWVALNWSWIAPKSCMRYVAKWSDSTLVSSVHQVVHEICCQVIRFNPGIIGSPSRAWDMLPSDQICCQVIRYVAKWSDLTLVSSVH